MIARTRSLQSAGRVQRAHACVATGIGWPATTLLGRVIELGVCGAAQRGGVSIERDELCEVIERAILRLAERERRVLVRHYLHWEPLAVSAQALGMSGALGRASAWRTTWRARSLCSGSPGPARRRARRPSAS